MSDLKVTRWWSNDLHLTVPMVDGEPEATTWAFEPRLAHRLFAERFGFFWKPCPKCGREFGGHEPSVGVWSPSIDDDDATGMMICPVCSEAQGWVDV